uniref:F-box domain-containing protein n=1 Tax=Steinernema glaseri TaxID=37863 RepID=A0A1I7YUH5_9BILA
MDFLPLVFLNAVCDLLDKENLGNLKKIRSRWSSNATVHHSKRRNVAVYLEANRDGTQILIKIKDDVRGSVPFDVDPKYDRIRHIHVLCYQEHLTRERGAWRSMESFKKKALPMLKALMVQCDLSFEHSFEFFSLFIHRNLADSIFEGLYDSEQLKMISTENYGGRCVGFIQHQIDLGQVEKLYLDGEEDWPETLKTSLNSFLKSPRFEKLVFGSNLTLDFDMARCFVDRFIRGELIGAHFSGTASFPLSRLKDFYSRSVHNVPCASNEMRLDGPNGILLVFNQQFLSLNVVSPQNWTWNP